MKNPNEDLLLTEDGHPIGEVVLADNDALPVDDNPRRIEENRADLLAQKAQELTGETDGDAAVVQLYPGYDDGEKRRRAMALLVSEGKSVEETAEAVGVPARTVAMWSHTGRWGDLVRDEIRARHEQSLLELSRMRSQKRIAVARRQLAQAEEIRDMAMAEMRTDGVTMSKQSAWTAASKVEQTLLGMSETGGVTDTEGKDDKSKNDGKRPLVMVFQGGGLPPVRKA